MENNNNPPHRYHQQQRSYQQAGYRQQHTRPQTQLPHGFHRDTPNSFNNYYYQSHAATLCPPPPQGFAAYPTAYDYNNQGYTATHQKSAYALSSSPTKRPRQEATSCCETCQITLESPSALTAHIASHTICTQCDYSASPKLVKAHFQSIHGQYQGSGFKTVTVAIPGCPIQKFRICVGNHPDDIKKWIAERRKKFPRQRPLEAPTPESKPLSLLEGYGSSSEDEVKETAATEELGLADNEDERSTLQQPAIHKFTGSSTNYRMKICRFFSRNGKCRHGDACSFRHELPVPQQSGNNSLLNKLLQSDMRREAALTLQLLHYIADCNYLQEQKKLKIDNSDRN